MRKFILNGKEIKGAELDFNAMCLMEEYGGDLSSGKTNSVVRAYVAVCMKSNPNLAGIEIQNHVLNGGKLDDIYLTLTEAIEESDFFRKLSEQTEMEEAKESK
ncbi:MAG: hypothetical protein HUJ98_14655 [Bacteroidaceae bacterium]|nr:hypothetical protein [Bacteroidaceae bacterium]